jgi:hypothetical protein
MTEAIHIAKLREAAEREQFEAFMARNKARLLDFAKRYISELVPEHREQFLAVALEQAWEKRGELKARNNQDAEPTVRILGWWEDYCLRPAALSRATWTLRTGWNGSERQTVTGRQLGRRSR